LAPGSYVPDGLADPRDLVTIVGNLIDNAIDAVQGAPAPRWVLIGGQVVGERAVLRVADSGPGLDPATAERAFTRGWSTKESPDGRPRGLGLALVGRAVPRAGGTVGVERGDPGAVFVVSLPVRERV
jgi:two-component system CitB family sensor kinase